MLANCSSIYSPSSQESCQPGVMPARSRAREWHFNLFTKHLEHSFAREWQSISE